MNSRYLDDLVPLIRLALARIRRIHDRELTDVYDDVPRAAVDVPEL